MNKQLWKSVRFGEVVKLQQGLCFNKKNNHLLRDNGIPVLLIKDLKNKTISQYTDEELTPKKFISKPTDIIYTRTGQVGLVFTNKIGVVHNNSFRIIANDKIYPLYIYWYLKQPTVIKHANKIAGGAAQPDLGHTAFKSIPFSYPEINVQKKLVSILSAYDNLIENNTRRIQILEEMAQRIYKEWFVDFKYPGHENDKLVESELGMIPEGWEIKKLSELMDFKGGSQPPKAEWSKDYKASYVRMIQIRDYKTDNHIMYVKDSSKLRKCDKYDIMIARYGASVGRICFGIEGAYNVALVKVIPKEKQILEFLRSYLQSYYFQNLLIGMSGRAAQEGFNKQTFDSIKIASPEDISILRNYSEIINLFYEERLMLQEKNKNLRQTRDLLLPKLISGKVDVYDLDIDTSILDD